MNHVVSLLAAALGTAVSTDPAALAECRLDKSGHESAAAPLAIVNAASIADVQATMRIATETGTPVVIRGAGTGLAGGAIAGKSASGETASRAFISNDQREATRAVPLTMRTGIMDLCRTLLAVVP